MKKTICTILITLTVAALAVHALASSGLLQISVDPSIRILVNGEEFKPKDVNGKDVMTFVYNGTTYAPLRALAEAYGLEVGYDADRKMATVSEPGTSAPAQTEPVSQTPAVTEVSWEIGYTNMDVWTNSIGTVWSHCIVEVKNTGTANLYLEESQFEFEYADGTLAELEEYVDGYPNIIAPGESGYYYSSFMPDELKPGEVYTIVPNLTIEKSKSAPVRYEASEFQTIDAKYGDIKVVGRAYNNTRDTADPELAAILFDANGNPLCVAHGYGDDFAPGAKQAIDATTDPLPGSITFSDVSDCKVFLYPHIYNW